MRASIGFTLLTNVLHMFDSKLFDLQQWTVTEISVTNYQTTRCNIPEKRRPRLHYAKSLESRMIAAGSWRCLRIAFKHCRICSGNGSLSYVGQSIVIYPILSPKISYIYHMMIIQKSFCVPPRLYLRIWLRVQISETYSSINSLLDATIIISLIISVSSTCFGR